MPCAAYTLEDAARQDVLPCSEISGHIDAFISEAYERYLTPVSYTHLYKDIQSLSHA